MYLAFQTCLFCRQVFVMYEAIPDPSVNSMMDIVNKAINLVTVMYVSVSKTFISRSCNLIEGYCVKNKFIKRKGRRSRQLVCYIERNSHVVITTAYYYYVIVTSFLSFRRFICKL